jgi:hypothetical protein
LLTLTAGTPASTQDKIGFANAFDVARDLLDALAGANHSGSKGFMQGNKGFSAASRARWSEHSPNG